MRVERLQHLRQSHSTVQMSFFHEVGTVKWLLIIEHRTVFTLFSGEQGLFHDLPVFVLDFWAQGNCPFSGPQVNRASLGGSCQLSAGEAQWIERFQNDLAFAGFFFNHLSRFNFDLGG